MMKFSERKFTQNEIDHTEDNEFTDWFKKMVPELAGSVDKLTADQVKVKIGYEEDEQGNARAVNLKNYSWEWDNLRKVAVINVNGLKTLYSKTKNKPKTLYGYDKAINELSAKSTDELGLDISVKIVRLLEGFSPVIGNMNKREEYISELNRERLKSNNRSEDDNDTSDLGDGTELFSSKGTILFKTRLFGFFGGTGLAERRRAFDANKKHQLQAKKRVSIEALEELNKSTKAEMNKYQKGLRY